MTPELSDAEIRLDLEAQNLEQLQVVHTDYLGTLPSEAVDDWDVGALYVRFSSDDDFRSASPSVQLDRGLAYLREQKVYVPWEGVVFEQGSATTISGRAIFRSLLEDAIRGRWKVVGAHMSDRLFRNERDHTDTERRFESHGVRLEWVGKLHGDEDLDPDLYAANQTQRTQNAMMARVTSKKIGGALEYYSSKGRPVGQLPEGFEVGLRGPNYRGRIGRPITYVRSEPLATIIAQGAQRYLAGASYPDLEAWAETTQLAGISARKTHLTAEWWRSTLRNPKYAGYQKVTVYAGFSKGNTEKYKRKRHELRRTPESPLIPCILPAIITLDEHRAILKRSAERRLGPKARKTYAEYLVSGVAYDSRCGHRLNVLTPRDEQGRFRMICRPPSNKGAGHNGSVWAHVAETQLDAIIGAVSLDDPQLLQMIEEELGDLHRAQHANEQTFRPNPEIAATRSAIASMGKTAPAHLTAPLHDYVAELLAGDEKRRGEYIRPVHLFRTAVEEIKKWSETWDLAPTAVKNGLLREAGVQVLIASPVDDPKGPARIVSIKAQHPTFALALAIAVRNVGLALPGPNPAQPRNAMDLMELSPDLSAILSLVPRGESHNLSNLFLVRPFVSITMRQAAAALGVTDTTTYGMARLGVIDAVRVDGAILTTQIEVDRLRKFSPQQLRALLRRVSPEDPDAGAVTAKEAANLLGISIATARTWISAGKIATHPGRRTLIPMTEIDRLGADRLADAA